MSKDIILIAESLDGHRSKWLERILDSTSLSGSHVYLYLLQNPEVDSARWITSNFSVEHLSIISTHQNKAEIVRSASTLQETNPENTIVIMDGERWFRQIWKNVRDVRILFMRPYLDELRAPALMRYLVKLFLISYCKLRSEFEVGLLAIPYSRPRIFPSNWVEDIPLVRIRDDSSTAELSPTENRRLDQFLITVPGFISKRKNPLLAIDVALKFRKYVPTTRLLFAGKVNKELNNVLINLPPGVQLLDRFLSNEEYVSVLDQTNVILLPYSNRGSSGVVLDAMQLKKPIIFSGSRHWRPAARMYGDNLQLVTLHKRSIVKALKKVWNDGETKKSVLFIEVERVSVIDFLIDGFERKFTA